MRSKLFLFILFIVSLVSCQNSCNDYLQHKSGQPLRWQSPPISVCSTQIHQSLIKESIHIWNNKGNTRYFKMTENVTCQIQLFYGTSECEGPNNDLGGLTRYTANKVFPYFHSVSIKICPDKKERELVIILHELGHALGLDHVWWHSSIMTPQTNSTKRPTDYDIKLLRNLYPTLRMREKY